MPRILTRAGIIRKIAKAYRSPNLDLSREECLYVLEKDGTLRLSDPMVVLILQELVGRYDPTSKNTENLEGLYYLRQSYEALGRVLDALDPVWDKYYDQEERQAKKERAKREKAKQKKESAANKAFDKATAVPVVTWETKPGPHLEKFLKDLKENAKKLKAKEKGAKGAKAKR